MLPKLSRRQQQLFDYLTQIIKEQGESPSLRQAAHQLQISHAAVAQLLKTLEKKGYIKRQGRYSRTLHLLGPAGRPLSPSSMREIPIIGKIRAGLPMYAQQEYDDSLFIDRQFYGGDNLFALRVKGDSMKDAAILEGDLVVCEARQYAKNGEIIVALISNEEATVKRFFLHSNRIELRPENQNYQPKFYPFSEILIQGKVIGVVRQYPSS